MRWRKAGCDWNAEDQVTVARCHDRASTVWKRGTLTSGHRCRQCFHPESADLSAAHPTCHVIIFIIFNKAGNHVSQCLMDADNSLPAFHQPAAQQCVSELCGSRAKFFLWASSCHICSFFFTARCTLVQSAVLRSHVVCPSVCLWRWWIVIT